MVTLDEATSASVSGAVDLATAADAMGIPVLRIADANAPESVRAIADRAPALIAVVGWTRLISEELLALPARGCIGFHASLLPRHRGRAPVNWSIIKGETVTGNTMMLLNPGIDTGVIVDQRATPIYVDDTCASVYDRVAGLGADMLRDNLTQLLDGTAHTRSQDERHADVLPKRTPAMGVTDWRRSPVEIHNWVRAQTLPYPGAFTHLEGEQVMIWATALPRATGAHGVPGEIVGMSEEGVVVASGSGAVTLTVIGFADEDPMPARRWAGAHGIAAGARFDLPDPETVAWSLGEGPRTIKPAAPAR